MYYISIQVFIYIYIKCLLAYFISLLLIDLQIYTAKTFHLSENYSYICNQ